MDYCEAEYEARRKDLYRLDTRLPSLLYQLKLARDMPDASPLAVKTCVHAIHLLHAYAKALQSPCTRR